MKFTKTKMLLREAQNVEKKWNSDMKNIIDEFQKNIPDDDDELLQKIEELKNQRRNDIKSRAYAIGIILSMNSVYANVLTQIYLNGKREKEIEAIEGCSASTTMRIHKKALKMFREKYIQLGLIIFEIDLRDDD